MSTPGVGAEYEITVPAYFALKLNSDKDVKDFSIQSNVSKQFGNLDDVIIDVTLESGKCLNFALQLKHSEKDKNLPPGGFEGPKGDFSLQKYCSSFKDISPFNQEKYHYIIYTSRSFDRKNKNEVKKFTMVEDDQCPGNFFFDTSSNTSVNNTYRFEVNNETPTSKIKNEKNGVITKITKAEYQTFFSKLTLFTCQKNFQDIERSIMEILNDESAVLFYLNLFRKWHQGRFSNKTIDRKTVNAHLVDIYLSSFMIMDHRLSDKYNHEMYLFEKTAKEFDVTVINESRDKFINNLIELDVDKLSLKSSEKENFEKYAGQYRMDPKSTLTECMLRLAKEYKFIEKTEMELNQKTRNQLFCLFFQNLVIVDFNQHSAEAMYKVIQVYQTREDKIKFILLGHGVDLSRLSSIQVFQNLENLSKKNDQLYQEITTQCTIFFQGRSSVTLKQLVESFDKVKPVFETKEIFKMLKGDYSIGEKKIDLPPHYVPRKVSTTVFGLDTILHLTKNMKNIIIVNFDGRFKQVEREIQNKDIQLIEILQYIGNNVSLRKKPTILSINGPNIEGEIETIHIERSNKSIHVFKMIADDVFILIRSTSKFECDNSNIRVFSQEKIHSIFDGSLNLLIAEPGMGKSTFMKFLRNECPWQFWPVFAELKSHSRFFSRVCSNDEVLAYFMATGAEKSDFLKQLKDNFIERKKIVLFLDGLDELSRDCVGNVLKIVVKLSHNGHRVWISSRKNLEERLTQEFNLPSLRTIEFCEEEQKTYIEDRLKSPYSKDEINEFIDRIFDGMKIVNNTQFLGIPLQLYIITQIFLDQKKLCTDITENFFVLTKLYRYFFKGRFQHCFQKYETNYSPFQPEAGEYLEQYETVALEYLFGEQNFKKLGIDYRLNQKFLRKIETGKEALGIIVRVEEGRPIFEHETYAEYFACVWFKKNQEKVILLKAELFSSVYEDLFIMLNIILAENYPLHLSIIYQNLKQFETFTSDTGSIDEGGRTALHVACCSGKKNSQEVDTSLYITMVDTLFEGKSSIGEIDHLFKFSCVDYACASKYMYAIDVALRKSLVEFSTLKEAIYLDDETLSFATDCVQRGYPNLLNHIIKKNLTNVEYSWEEDLCKTAMPACCQNKREDLTLRYVETVQVLIENVVNFNEVVQNYFGSTALYMSCKYGLFELVKRLFDKQAPLIVDPDMNNTILHSACQCENPNKEVINFLLENDFDINAPNIYEATPFHYACLNGHFDAVYTILQREDSIISHSLQTLDALGDNALHYAANSQGDNKNIISLLIDKGIEVNSQNKYGRTPLHQACRGHNLVNSRHLLENGAKVNITDSQRDAALKYAVESSSLKIKLELIDLFIQYKYDMSAEHATRALNVECKKGDLIVVKKLIDNGAKIDDETLHYALKSSRGNKEIIHLVLKDKHVNINATDARGLTALHVASEAGNLENVDILLESGAEAISVFEASITGTVYEQEIVELLVDKGNIISYYQNGLDPINLLKIASDSRNLEIIKNLLANGLNENILDNFKRNALHYASISSDENGAIISELIEAGFNVNAHDENGIIPLHLACQNCSFNNVKMLLQNGAELNHADRRGNNTLHYASMSSGDNKEIIDFLLDKGFDLHAQNFDGKRAIQLAGCKNVNTLKELLENGAK